MCAASSATGAPLALPCPLKCRASIRDSLEQVGGGVLVESEHELEDLLGGDGLRGVLRAIANLWPGIGHLQVFRYVGGRGQEEREVDLEGAAERKHVVDREPPMPAEPVHALCDREGRLGPSRTDVRLKQLGRLFGRTFAELTDLYGHLMPGAQEQAADLLDAYLAREACGSAAAPTAAHPAKPQS
jgi:hypothetical protein